jgi:hypothetical protein
MQIRIAQPLPFDPNQVTPGVVGFAATVLVAVAVMLLLWDFNRRVRRINDRAHIKERIEAELAEREAARGRAVDAAGETTVAEPPSQSRPDAPDAPADDAPRRSA